MRRKTCKWLAMGIRRGVRLSNVSRCAGTFSILALCLLTAPAAGQDCNENGIPDECDIDCGAPGGACDIPGCGQSADCNENGVPDDCDLGEYYFVLEWGTCGPDPGEFGYPIGVAVDSEGFVYVCDSPNLRIQKFDPNGNLVDDPWETSGHCWGVAVDETEECYIYVSNYYTNSPPTPGYQIDVFTCEGDYVDTWGEPGSGPGQLDRPSGIGVAADGDVWVVESGNDRVQKFTGDGVHICMAGSHGCGDEQFYNPYALAVSPCGNVYVADSWCGRVQVLDSDSDTCDFVTNWDWDGFGYHSPSGGLAVDADCDVYVSDHPSDRIVKFTADWAYLTDWGGAGDGPGKFDTPLGLAVDSAGNVYAADEFNCRIQKFRAWSDCNENGILDECDMADCNGSPWCDDCNDNGRIDECDIASGTSPDENGNGIPDECEPELEIRPGLDIKPGSCPNPLNRESHGVLPVALVSRTDFDATTIDVSTVVMSRADGMGGSVAPHEGAPGPHSVFEDVATPFVGEPCDCHDVEGDGIVDLSMKFKTVDVVEALELNDLPAGAVAELVVTGSLLDGREFEARDCITLVPKAHVASTAGSRFSFGP